MKDWNTDMPEDERRAAEERMKKTALFGIRYRSSSTSTALLARMKPITLRQWITERIFGVRCRTCNIKLNKRYWTERRKRIPGSPLPYEHLIWIICRDRRLCVDCAIAEERSLK
jgi:hypothetical protein